MFSSSTRKIRRAWMMASCQTLSTSRSQCPTASSSSHLWPLESFKSQTQVYSHPDFLHVLPDGQTHFFLCFACKSRTALVIFYSGPTDACGWPIIQVGEPGLDTGLSISFEVRESNSEVSEAKSAMDSLKFYGRGRGCFMLCWQVVKHGAFGRSARP